MMSTRGRLRTAQTSYTKTQVPTSRASKIDGGLIQVHPKNYSKETYWQEQICGVDMGEKFSLET